MDRKCITFGPRFSYFCNYFYFTLLQLLGAGTWPLVQAHSSLLTAVLHLSRAKLLDSTVEHSVVSPTGTAEGLFALVHMLVPHSAGFLEHCLFVVLEWYRISNMSHDSIFVILN